jgi:hypothetical protein
VGVITGLVLLAILCYFLFRVVKGTGFQLEAYTNYLLDVLGVLDGDTTVY